MLIQAKTLQGYKLACLDGEIGKVDEFFFDDRHWTIRYLVANTGNWLTGRKVLISPYALADASKEEHNIAVNLTQKQIEESPSLSSDEPVSRQFEVTYNAFYQWPAYWDGPNSWGYFPYIERDRKKWREPTTLEKSWDPNLRSTHDVSGHDVHASDGELGHVEDFIIDDESWAIRYLIVDTRNWWPGKKVLVSPQWIDRISWDESKVFINLSRETIQHSPEYTDESSLTRDYEARLRRHYNFHGYWLDKPAA